MKFPPWQRGKECLPKVDTGILEGICPTATCMLGNAWSHTSFTKIPLKLTWLETWCISNYWNDTTDHGADYASITYIINYNILGL